MLQLFPSCSPQEVLGSVPQMWLLLIKEDEPFSMVRADLEVHEAADSAPFRYDIYYNLTYMKYIT